MKMMNRREFLVAGTLGTAGVLMPFTSAFADTLSSGNNTSSSFEIQPTEITKGDAVLEVPTASVTITDKGFGVSKPIEKDDVTVVCTQNGYIGDFQVVAYDITFMAFTVDDMARAGIPMPRDWQGATSNGDVTIHTEVWFRTDSQNRQIFLEKIAGYYRPGNAVSITERKVIWANGDRYAFNPGGNDYTKNVTIGWRPWLNNSSIYHFANTWCNAYLGNSGVYRQFDCVVLYG